MEAYTYFPPLVLSLPVPGLLIYASKEPVAKEPVSEMNLPCEIPQLDIPDVGRN